MISFFLLVLFPMFLSAWYLFFVAKDQYASRLGFVVRTEEAKSPTELLGGIVGLSKSSSSDTDILFEFIQSQRIVRLVDEKLDLRALYHAPEDPVYGLAQDASIEDLVWYWNRMVKVFYDTNSGLIELRIQAFSADTAKAVAEAIFEESGAMINELSDIARADATRYARDELENALERLRRARRAVSEFRLRTQIVDPQADILGRMGLLNSLQEQLATAQIDLDLLNQTTSPGDPRVENATRRVRVIEERIAEERARFGRPEGDEDTAYVTLIGEYEGLSVDLEFAQNAYIVAQAAFDAAQAEALRQSRYLAPYVRPTLAETAEYPQRFVILLVMGMFLFSGWAIAAMVYYAIRDRR